MLARRLSAALAGLVLLVPAYPAGAQEQPPMVQTLSVSPAIVDNSLDPGASFTIDIALTNQTASPIAVRAATRELVTDMPIAEERKSAFDASSWFAIENPDFLLLAQERRQVPVKVSVPKNAEPGGHYATINFDSFVPQQQTSGVTTVNARVGVVVLLTVSGDVRERVSIVGPIATKNWQPDALPTTFDLRLRNDGNVHVLPRGEIVIRDVFGRVVKRVPMQTGTLLPGTENNYSATWEHGLVAGVYNAEAEITAGTQQTKLGPATKRFVVAPLVLIIPIGVVVLLLTIVVLVATYRRKRRKKRETTAQNTEPPGSTPSTEVPSNVSDL